MDEERRRGSTWGDMGRYGEIERRREAPGEIWGDVGVTPGRYREVQGVGGSRVRGGSEGKGM